MAIPNKVVNKTLYSHIKQQMKREHARAGKRWGIYSSSQLVARYKKAGGKYKGKKQTCIGTSRWYKETWINVCKLPKIVKCGRSKFDPSGRKFPYCRPFYRVSKNTPKTVKELTQREIKTRCKLKKKNPRKILRRFSTRR